MDWQQLIPLLGPANASLARNDGLPEGVQIPPFCSDPLQPVDLSRTSQPLPAEATNLAAAGQSQACLT
jgi:uncharacterized protein (DUF3084 family)